MNKINKVPRARAAMLQEFFYISSNGEVKRAVEIDNVFNTELYDSGNYFLTKEEANEALKKK